jgi:hypothetical protein
VFVPAFAVARHLLDRVLAMQRRRRQTRGSATAITPWEAPDLAFADTVIANDLEPPPPSGIVVSDEADAVIAPPDLVTHVLTPMTMAASWHPEAPAPAYDPGVVTRLSSAFERVRHGVNESRAEMNLLWSATATLEEVADDGGVVHRRPVTLRRRLTMLLSFFEWERADLLRAAWIGLGAFLLAATVGALLFF